MVRNHATGAYHTYCWYRRREYWNVTLPAFTNAGGTVTDNCGVVASSFNLTQTDNGTCPRTLTRTYTIADSCGNTGQCVQTIMIDDITPPMITWPANVSFECIGSVPA